MKALCLIASLALATLLTACASVDSDQGPPKHALPTVSSPGVAGEAAPPRSARPKARGAPGPRPPPLDSGGGGGSEEKIDDVEVVGMSGAFPEPMVRPSSAPTHQALATPTPANDAGSDAIDALPKANFAFNSPATLELNQTTQIQLRVSLAESMDRLRAEIRAAGDIEAGQVPVSNRIEAKLTGTNFEITSISDDIQLLGSRHTTEWSWDVKALEEGEQVLHLSLTSLLTVSGQEVRRSFPSLDRKIVVQVSGVNRASMLFGKYWQWMMTAIFIPLCGWGVKKLRGRQVPQPAAAH
jgi:hypothetical protein